MRTIVKSFVAAFAFVILLGSVFAGTASALPPVDSVDQIQSSSMVQESISTSSASSSSFRQNYGSSRNSSNSSNRGLIKLVLFVPLLLLRLLKN